MVPGQIATHLADPELTLAFEATVAADELILHKTHFRELTGMGQFVVLVWLCGIKSVHGDRIL